MKKADVLNDFFTSVLPGKICHQKTQTTLIHGKVWSKEDFYSLVKSPVREHLNKMDNTNLWTWYNASTRVDGAGQHHSRTVLIISEELWWLDETHEDLGRVNVSLLFKKGKKGLGNYRLVSLILISGNVMEQILMKTISNPPGNTQKDGDSK